jgi:phosphodiesterase/alkaline phosphatase D-like protein
MTEHHESMFLMTPRQHRLKRGHIRNTVWLTADVYYAAHYFGRFAREPEKTAPLSTQPTANAFRTSFTNCAAARHARSVPCLWQS